MPTPFKKSEEPLPDFEECEGHFGCFEDGCGRVTGTAIYFPKIELLKFTCPAGHKNQVTIAL